MKGKDLFECVSQATGLPQGSISKELDQLIKNSGSDLERLSIDDLRAIVAEYLQDTFLELSKSRDS